MHPTLTFELVQQDHLDRIESARRIAQAQARAAERQSGRRPVTTDRGHPPERRPRWRPRPVLAATTTGAAAG
jgi:hypothetical protein